MQTLIKLECLYKYQTKQNLEQEMLPGIEKKESHNNKVVKSSKRHNDRSKICLNDSANTCKPGLVNLNTEALGMSCCIYNGTMSKAMVTLNLIVVKMCRGGGQWFMFYKQEYIQHLKIAHPVIHQELLACRAH